VNLQGGKNEAWLDPNDPTVAKMQITQGLVATFDSADWPLVREWRWCARRKPNVVYVVTTKKGSHNLLGLHNLVCPCPSGHTPDHIDRDGLNNRRCNLRPATPKEQIANARIKRGAEQGLAKLSDSAVLEIRRTYIPGQITHKELAEKFGVGRTTVSAVLAGKNWRHL